MSVIISHSWSEKPPLGVQLNLGHSLANGLRCFFVLNEGSGGIVYDLVRGTIGKFDLASANDPFWVSANNGSAIKQSGEDSGGIVIPEDGWLHPTDPAITLMARVEGPSTTTGAPRIFGHQVNGNASPFHNFMLTLGGTNWDSRFDAVAYTIVAKVTGEICTIAATYDGANVRGYHNGLLKATTAKTGNISNSAGQLVIGGDGSQGAGATEGFQAPIYWCAMWARVLGPDEIMAMQVAPYQIFQSLFWRRWLGAVPFTLDLSAYRWRDDDNNEALASYLAAENTAISRAKEQNVRLRVQIDADGDPSSQQYKLQYRRSGNTEWIDVEP